VADNVFSPLVHEPHDVRSGLSRGFQPLWSERVHSRSQKANHLSLCKRFRLSVASTSAADMCKFITAHLQDGPARQRANS